MTEERWEDIKHMVAEKFGQKDAEREELAQGGYSESLEFESPLGRVELEFTHKPRLLDTKTLYSNRIGSDVKVERVYSKDEFANTLKAYLFDQATGDWGQIEGSSLFEA